MPELSHPMADLVRGTAQFTGDIPLPAGCLHAAVAVSPHPHARFTPVPGEVRGSVAVLRAGDIPGTNDIGNLFADEPLLADGLTTWVGQPFALVLAHSHDAAWRAAVEVRAQWEPRPAIFDERAAYAAGQLIVPPRTFALGDVDHSFAQCDLVVSGRARTGAAEHLYLETQCALAVPRPDGSIHIHSATQAPATVQRAVARVLGLPMHAVTIEVARLGGGFGGKEEQATMWAALAGLGAQVTGRPVRIWPDRRADMIITGKRHPYSADYRLGLAGDGRFLAYEAVLYQNAGAVADLSTAILERSLLHATNAYFVPNVRVTAASCRTNLPPNTAFRGFGAPQSIFVIEAAIRHAARRLGVPAMQLQERNLLRTGDPLPYGMLAEDARVRLCWNRLAERDDLPGRLAQVQAHNDRGGWTRRGIDVVPVCFGIGFTATLLNQATALVNVYVDGSVSVTTGAVEMGQGVHEKIRDTVARAFGIERRLVRIETTSTERIANASPTAASTGADLNCQAARQACRTILAAICDIQPTQGHPTRGTWPERVAAAYAARRQLSAMAHYATPDLSFDRQANRGRPFSYHVYGAALVESQVDILRGTGHIQRVSVVHDAGTPTVEGVDIGQVTGAVIQGLGWMTTEEIRHSHGRLLTDSLANYKIPDLAWSPPIEVDLLPSAANPPTAPSGKAVGEPPLVYGLGGYFSLRAAIQSYRDLDGRDDVAPMTNERIFELAHECSAPNPQ